MFTWIGKTIKDMIRCEDIRENIGVASIEDTIRENHLRWLNHVYKRPE